MENDADVRVAEIMGIHLRAGLYPESGVFATAAQWRALLEHPNEGVIVTITLYKFCADLTDEDRRALQEDNEVNRMIKRLGDAAGMSEVFTGAMMCTWIGDHEDWDIIGVKRFPDKKSFVNLCTDPAYIEAQKNRQSIVSRQRTFIFHPF